VEKFLTDLGSLGKPLALTVVIEVATVSSQHLLSIAINGKFHVLKEETGCVKNERFSEMQK
jgi:hypothetical protein